MSENYPSDVKLNENPDGTVSFATEVVATIAGLAATEVDGVASMSSPSSGLADMFSRKNTRNFTKGVRIDLDGNRVAVDITIVVDYGSPVPDVARNIQENVKKAIETMTGLDVKCVDIHVSGISFEREQRANAELDEQHRKMLEKSAETVAEEETEAGEEVEVEAEVVEVVEAKVPAREEDAGPVEAKKAEEPLEEARPETPAEPAPAPQPAPEPAPAPVEEAPAEPVRKVYEDEPELIPGDEEPAHFTGGAEDE